MENHPINKTSRILLFLCALVLLVVLKVPMWRIDLNAPQYPEGLKLLIYPNHIGGNVDIVNGLNHYIGMKPLHTADFIEFTILPAIILAFAILLLTAALLKKRWMLTTVFVLFVAFGVVAMVDFWRWEYNYGHHLNPDAPIIVPGMAYQPPLIGFKQLLNFGAYSVPALGGYMFIGVGIVLMAMNIVQYRITRKFKNAVYNNKAIPRAAVLIVTATLFFQSCSSGPTAIVVGKDKCDYCKMPVSDNRFGAEIITAKGKIYKFDDGHCVLSFLHAPSFEKEKNYKIYFVNFSASHSLIPASTSFFLKSDGLRSPMNGNVAAFNNKDSLQVATRKYPGTSLDWNQLDKP